MINKGNGSKKVCLCYLGDGALNQGSLHEAMNLAGLWSLPVIYIVENNRYSMGTSIERGTTMPHNLLAKSAAYGIEGLRIDEADGMDVLRLYDRFKPYADECREMQKPGFVDLHTYRYQGHSMSDPQKYRTKDEVEKVKERDSIALLEKFLLGTASSTSDIRHPTSDIDHSSHPAFGSLPEPDFIEMQKGVKASVAAAVKFAEESPIPDAAELYSDVYANPQPNLSPIREYTQGARNPLL